MSDTEVHAPCPLYESLEWKLSSHYWREAGLLPFLENSVPYVVNNSGRLSENAAVLLFENLEEHPPKGGTVVAVELGAGSGLFAKLFLDAFRDICRDQNRDHYDRLTYVVSDRSPSTAEHWRQRNMFEGHERVQIVRIDALDPMTACLADGSTQKIESPRAVFCNYVLDVLPATIWRKNGSKIEEMLVGTHLVPGSLKLEEVTHLTLDEIRARACGDNDASEFLPLLPMLEPQVRFGPPRNVPRWGSMAEALVRTLKDGERVAINFGAFDCLNQCLSHLEPGGFVLVNDYGMVNLEELRATIPQRFGSTVAVGLNFPLLERCFLDHGFRVQTPPGDGDRGVHTRLVSRDDLPRTGHVLTVRFAAEIERELDAPLVAAREHASAGRTSEALDAYRAVLERTPRDWNLLGEIAEFIGLIVRDFQSGIQVARRAIELNPWTSAWLWNVLGDCLYYLERYPDAHQAFLKAESIDPCDVRTSLNLGHSYACIGQHGSALLAIARGLIHDKGAYRLRLLQQQEQLLGVLAGRRSAAQDRLTRRLERLGAA